MGTRFVAAQAGVRSAGQGAATLRRKIPSAGLSVDDHASGRNDDRRERDAALPPGADRIDVYRMKLLGQRWTSRDGVFTAKSLREEEKDGAGGESEVKRQRRRTFFRRQKKGEEEAVEGGGEA
ncbi:hypothetical protein K0M31_016478 [Melipona bicolor]|uniref:Uncharacterized protein n=1 Tax=Melipona bicolor TaxID=60889 RepID=A0AA40G7A3_9HYME|nr:hypothetical protein K0M31_016478 [Melipona bicolor]